MNNPEDLDVASFFNSFFDKSSKDKLHTAIPAEVVSYDKAKRECSIKPAVRRKDSQESPTLENVKVSFPYGGGFGMIFDLKAKDTGLLIFSEVSIAEWIHGGGVVTTNSKRHHHLSDAFFIPGVLPDAKIPSYSPSGEGISLYKKDGTKRITLNDSGVEVVGDLKVSGDVKATGSIEAGLDVVAGCNTVAISLLKHNHTFLPGPPPTVGPPIPAPPAP